MATVTVEQVLIVVRSQIGYREGPNNDTKYGDWYGTPNVAWCGQFVSWVAAQAKATAIIPKYQYTPNGAAWFKARSRYGKTPRVGAIGFVYFASLGRIAHTFIVESINSDGTITTIEGNTNNTGSSEGVGVFRLKRRVTSSITFGYPAYAVAAPAPSKPKVKYEAYRSVSAGSRTVKLGSVGSDVEYLQQRIGTPVDGAFGPATEDAVKAWQRARKITVDGIVGPQTWATVKGAVVSKPKPKTPVAPPFPLPKGYYFGPKSGPKQSISGYYSYASELEKWQKQMRLRGWTISVDGRYGNQTEAVARAFQKEKRLRVTGLIDPTTWNAAWTAKVT